MKIGRLNVLIAIGVLALTAASRADVLVHEPFAYSLADETPLNGIQAAGTGLSGKYSASTKTNTHAGSDGAGVANYSAAGLEFGENFHPVSGGAAVVSATAGSAQNGMPTAQTLSTALSPAVTGPIYCSFLIKFAADFATINNGHTSVHLKVGDLVMSANMFKNYQNAVGVGFGKPEPGNDPFDPFAETIFLVVAKFANLETGSPEARLWVFDEFTYEQWSKDGATEAGLSKYAQVQATSLAKSGNFRFDGSYKVEISSGNFAGNNITATVDEFILGTALADVTTGGTSQAKSK